MRCMSVPVLNRGRRGCIAAATGGSSSSGGLSTHFARYVNERGLRPAPVHGPSPLLSPSAVVTAQLEALQRNDWPDADAGVRTAHRFALPHSCRPVRRRRGEPEAEATGVHPDSLPSTSTLVRAWGVQESWLTFQEFQQQLHSTPFNTMLLCDSWKPASLLTFSGAQHVRQAVSITKTSSVPSEAPSHRVFTFCLELVERPGAYKSCWLTAGVRLGDCSQL